MTAPTVALGTELNEQTTKLVDQLVQDRVASRIAAEDPTLWGPEAEAESTIRLAWVHAAATARPLVPEILALRDELHGRGVTRVVLCGMGGSSLAPEVIAHTEGAELVILDSTNPDQVRAAVTDAPEQTAVVVSSKSGSTVETDSQKRAFEQAFRDLGIDPAERIVIVTDPGSPLEVRSREAGYRVFTADPHVGGRFSALTAFGLVPSGLAGVDIAALLDDAEGASAALFADDPANPALVLGAAMSGVDAAGQAPSRNKLGLVPVDTPLIGFPDWAEQLIAESTGKEGTGVLPIVLQEGSYETSAGLDDVRIVRLVKQAAQPGPQEIAVSGSLGAQFVLWEVATAVAGRLLRINPFDQPDVESAKVAARTLLGTEPGADQGGSTAAPLPLDRGVSAVLDALSSMPANGYVAVQAYAKRNEDGSAQELRELLAERSGRPVTFGWGPRFLHSTGQFHKGGPAVGVFVQLVQDIDRDLAIPGLPFSFGQLITAQAAGDAGVLAAHGLTVVRVAVPAGQGAVRAVLEALERAA